MIEGGLSDVSTSGKSFKGMTITPYGMVRWGDGDERPWSVAFLLTSYESYNGRSMFRNDTFKHVEIIWRNAYIQ